MVIWILGWFWGKQAVFAFFALFSFFMCKGRGQEQLFVKQSMIFDALCGWRLESTAFVYLRYYITVYIEGKGRER